VTFCPIINRAKLELDHGKTLIRAEYGYKWPVGFNARECASWHNDCFIYGMNNVIETAKGVRKMKKNTKRCAFCGEKTLNLYGLSAVLGAGKSIFATNALQMGSNNLIPARSAGKEPKWDTN